MTMVKISNFWILTSIFLLFLFVRFFHFPEVVNFSTDQALFSLKALEIWQTKKLTLIGPTFSINVNGRYAFQGPAIYYFHLFFLLLGNWQPITSSLMFVLFAGLMIFPLFQGTKWLINQKVAYLMVLFYTFFLPFINYTRFLWNPNYQLALLPLVVWLVGKFQVTQQKKWFLFFAIGLGLLLQFHYQFFAIILALFIYYFLKRKFSFKLFTIFLIGLGIGFFPLILFELRHQFYNTKRILIFFATLMQTHSTSSTSFHFQPHYVLSIAFVSGLVVLGILRQKISYTFVKIVGLILLCSALWLTFQLPTHAFGMPNNWNFLKEQKAASIIEQQHLDNFRVVNLIYDTKAVVQTYLLTKDGVSQKFDDYSQNEYLFVLGTDNELVTTQAYEVTTFTPKQLKQAWQLDDQGHNLYLFQRQHSQNK